MPNPAIKGSILSIYNVEETHSPTLYFATDGEGNDFGYIAGNNGYGDLAKAEYFDAESYGNRSVIDGFYVWFGAAKVRFQLSVLSL